MYTLFYTSIFCFFALISSVTLAGDMYAFASADMAYSNFRVEGQVDTRVDHELYDRGRSISEHTFGNLHSGSHPAITIGVGHRENNRFVEVGAFFSQFDMRGNSDIGTIHIDGDIYGLTAKYGWIKGRFSPYVGGYALQVKEQVHTWILNGPDDVSEYHDKVSDTTAGMMAGIGYRVMDNLSVNVEYMNGLGDVDSTGKSNMYRVGLQYRY